MSGFFYEQDADPAALDGQRVAVVGYGNQGRPWALNLRDSGVSVSVHVRADESRDQAVADGFEAAGIGSASAADVVCVLVPDDAIPGLGLSPRPEALTIVASGYTLAFDRFTPGGDIAMVAPRMLGPEVRRCYTEGVGFITAVGVHQDVTGTAEPRMLAVAKAIGGLRQGAISMTPHQEAVLDLAVEQLLSPALTHVNATFAMVMLELGIPLEAITTELFYSGEVERNYRLLREEGFVTQLNHHSPASQYGQLSRRGRFDHLDVGTTMRELAGEIASGRFADEWDTESAAGAPRLNELRDQHAGEMMKALEADLRTKLGPNSGPAIATPGG
ncbi:NAD(P)-binding domain-containing protein [Candidatus Poriferisocius sp.]|uniref:NAD(P)-binding domain-containing protein n=1 Tax=Candidatus Poriferisocius sp. TaxID=3101276 RepID=UPI003B02BC6A